MTMCKGVAVQNRSQPACVDFQLDSLIEPYFLPAGDIELGSK